MQDNSKIFHRAIGKIINKIRKEKGIKYSDLCYENDIPTSTYDDIVGAKTQARFYNVAKIVNALGISFEEFGRYLDKELPEKFLKDDD